MPVLIVTSTDNEDIARKIAKGVVQRRMGAAANISQAESFYRWDDEVHNHPEFVVAIKTTRGQFSAVEGFIKEVHNYELPQIIMTPILGGSEAYLNWIRDQISILETYPVKILMRQEEAAASGFAPESTSENSSS